MEIIYREATIEDVPKIIALCDECFFEKTSLDYALKAFKEAENDDHQIYIVGLYGNEIIAHSKITVIPTIYEKMNTYAMINHVCVKEEYRRHNIATQMLTEVEKICKKHNCKKMELWSANFRVPAQSCYKKFGFEAEDVKFFSKEI